MKDDCSASLVFDRFGALFRSAMGGIAAAVGITYLSCTAMGLPDAVSALSAFAVSALCACSFAAVVAIVRRCCVRFEGHHSHGRHDNLLLLPYSSVGVAMRQWRGCQQSDGTTLTATTICSPFTRSGGSSSGTCKAWRTHTCDHLADVK